MSFEFTPPPTGHEVIDHLRDIQLVARTITDPLEKAQFISQAIVNSQLELEEGLYCTELEVGSTTVLGAIRERNQLRRFKFLDALKFHGVPFSCNFLVGSQESASCVAVSFALPRVVEPEVAAAEYSKFTFEVPVLAINEVEILQ
jgi:hypothetical protein